MEGPSTPNALFEPAQYTKLLRSAVSLMLTPGNGVEGVIFPKFPTLGLIPSPNPAAQTGYNRFRAEGVAAWNRIAEKMTTYFPGEVMYFPIGSSILLDGHYSSWLPSEGDPNAPPASWVRVRKLDNVHLCPEGSARLGDAVLANMTALFGLAPAGTQWAQGEWTTDPDFNDPPGACPDDHPPSAP
jgi:hypothetical protein